MFHDKTLLILGASGQDGHLIRTLLTKSQLISVSCKVLEDFGNSNEKRIRVRNYSLQEIKDIMEQYQPNYILNFAGLTSVAECERDPLKSFELNYQLVTRIVEAIKYVDLPRYIYMQCSSSEIFGEGVTNCNENRDLNPLTIYGKHKAQALVFLRNEITGNLLNLVLFNHESEYRAETFVTKKIINGVIDFNDTGRKIKIGNVNSARDWSYAPDFIKGMLNLLKSNKTGDYVFGSGKSYTVKEFALLVMNFAKVQVSFSELFELDDNFVRKIETPPLVADSGKYLSEFGNLNSFSFEKMVETLYLNSYLKRRKTDLIF